MQAVSPQCLAGTSLHHKHKLRTTWAATQQEREFPFLQHHISGHTTLPPVQSAGLEDF